MNQERTRNGSVTPAGQLIKRQIIGSAQWVAQLTMVKKIVRFTNPEHPKKKKKKKKKKIHGGYA